MKNIVCNVRNTQGITTGVQRYTSEIIRRISNDIDLIKPRTNFSGIKGHIWEQSLLPLRLKGRLLWSPANTGPLFIKNQVVSIMDMSPIDHPEWSSKKFSDWYTFMIPKLINNSKAIITISEFSKSRIIAHYPEAHDKIFVTHLAADKRFQKKYIKVNIDKLNLPSKNYILALGSIEPRKNLNLLLKAWQSIVSSLPKDIYLVISGSSSNQKVFGKYNLNEIPPRVHFTGYIDDDDLPNLYSNAIALTYTPFYEGFGLPPLEAMSCGTPVITSNTTSIPEVVGSAAIKIDPLEVHECAEAILGVINNKDLRKKIFIDGLKRSSLFNWQDTANKTLEILQKAL